MLDRRLHRNLAQCVMLTLTGLAPAAVSTAQGPPPEWTLSVGAQESNEFDRVTNGVRAEDLILDNFSITLGVNGRSQYSQYGLFGRVGYDYYRKGESRDHIVYGAGFSLNREASSRFRSNLTLGVDRGFTAQTLSNLGILAPEVRTTTGTASWGMQYQSGPRTSISTAFSYNYLLFETDQPISGSQLVLGESPFRDDFSPILNGPADGSELVLPDVERTLLGIVATEGFLSRETRSHWGSAMFGLKRELSEYTSMGFDFGGGYRTIDTAVDELREGAEAGFRFWTERRIGQSSGVGAAYTVMRSLVSAPESTVHNLVGGVGFFPRGKNISLRLSGGASYYQAEGSPSKLTPVADASFTTGLSRSTTFAAAYRRQFAQSLGFGSTLLIDFATLSLAQKFGRRVDLSLMAGASLATDPTVEDTGYDALNAGGTLTYRIVEGLALGTSFFRLRTESTTPVGTSEATRNLWSFFLTYTARWN